MKTKKAASEEPMRPLNFIPGGDLRSRVVSSAVSSARRGLTSVFGMGTGVALAVRPPGNFGRVAKFHRRFTILKNLAIKFDNEGSGVNHKYCWRVAFREKTLFLPRIPSGFTRNPDRTAALGKFYGKAERPISTGKLHALLRFHLPPIKVVVFDWPS